jgi:hypothetical protein
MILHGYKLTHTDQRFEPTIPLLPLPLRASQQCIDDRPQITAKLPKSRKVRASGEKRELDMSEWSL